MAIAAVPASYITGKDEHMKIRTGHYSRNSGPPKGSEMLLRATRLSTRLISARRSVLARSDAAKAA